MSSLKFKEYAKKYRLKNRDRIRAKYKIYYQKNRLEIINRIKRNAKEDPEKRRVYTRNKHRTDIQFRLATNLRHRLNMAIRADQRKGSAVRDLGCSILHLKEYLESKFEVGMSWENYGLRGWHVDHVIPLSLFDLTNVEQFKKAVHFSNLQPMWAGANISKGGLNRQETPKKITYLYD